tara:strand:- start:544 stop:849 length:306 start_codon:yes stop_codon:yes gene_type:complete
MASVVQGDIIRGVTQDKYLEEWYKYITPDNAVKIFNKLLAEPDYVAYSFLKAKMIAQRHNFTDAFIVESIAPHYGTGGAFDQVRGDSFWGDGYQFRPGDQS